MRIICDSDNYCIIGFGVDGQHAMLPAGDCEIMDKNLKREIFLGSELAGHFREDVGKPVASESTVEEVDDFLGKFDAVVARPVTVH